MQTADDLNARLEASERDEALGAALHEIGFRRRRTLVQMMWRPG